MVALESDGFCWVEVKPLGPVQLNAEPAGATPFRKMLLPAHTSGVDVVASMVATGGSAGDVLSDVRSGVLAPITACIRSFCPLLNIIMQASST